MKNTSSTILANPFINALIGFGSTGLKHSPRTDLARRQINNKDFIVLCMYAHGPMTANDLAELAHEWRGDEKVLNAYFGPHYGHTADDMNGMVPYTGNFGRRDGSVDMYWYRARDHKKAVRFSGCWEPAQSYANNLTVQGVARAKELIGMLGDDFFARNGR